MNLMRDIERLVRNFARPGFFRRDAEGNEHAINGYVVRLEYEHRVREDNSLCMNSETVVVLAASRVDAKTIASRPYNRVNILSVEEANPSVNPTLFRISQV